MLFSTTYSSTSLLEFASTEAVHVSKIARLSPSLKNWEEPGDEAVAVFVRLHICAHVNRAGKLMIKDHIMSSMHSNLNCRSSCHLDVHETF